MLIDYELEMTTNGGQAFSGAAVGTKSIDLGAAGIDIGNGEPLRAFAKATVAASATTVLLELYSGATAGATTTLLGARLVPAAELAENEIVMFANVMPEEVSGALRYLTFQATPAGGAATVTLKAWLVKANDATPQTLPTGTGIDLD